MNKQAYRVIFNVRRGALMAVAENVSSQGKNTSESAGAGTLASSVKSGGMRFAQLGVMIAVLFGGVTVVHGQIVADRNAASRPVVDQSANGKPVVQIVTPNAAGVSHNRYDQFNVGQGGAILNNSNAVTQTQQAGYINGNAALANGSARMILNEVTGASRSQLNGYIEVAGQRADVIVANPNGISCSGCGFINTSRGVLTTGTPEFAADGSLSNLRVKRGDISIDGNGMNAAGIDRVDLIARSVQVNGDLWAKQLNVVTGANLVNYANLGVQVIQGDGATPTVGIDLGQLGGMYANKIRLVGTEAGVGVRSMGNIAAQGGDISIDNSGKVTLNGSTTATGNMTIHSGDGIANGGSLYGQQNVALTSEGVISNSGTFAAQANLSLNAASVNSTGTLGAGIDGSGNVTQGGNLSLDASGTIAATGRNTAGGNISLSALSLNLSGAQTSTAGNATLTARAGDIDHTGGNLQTVGIATLTAAGTINNTQGMLNASQLVLTTGNLTNQHGQIIQSGTGITQIAVTNTLDNSNGGLLKTNSADLSLTPQTLINDGGTIALAGSGRLTLNIGNGAGSLSSVGGSIGGNGLVAVTAGSIANRGGSIFSQQQLSISATQGIIDNSVGGVMRSAAGMDVNAAGAINNSGGVIEANGATDTLTVSGSSIDNSAGRIANSGSGLTQINGGSQITNRQGTLGGNGDLAIQTAQLDNSQQGQVIATGNQTLDIGSAMSNDGGRLFAGKNLTVNAANAGVTNVGGNIGAAGDIALTALSLDNTSGFIGSTVGSNRNIGLSTLRNLVNTAGTVSSSRNLKVTANTIVGNGNVVAAQDLMLNLQGDYVNAAGNVLTANHDLTLTTTGNLSNTGTLTAVNALTLNAVNVDNQATGLINASATTIQASNAITNTGRIYGDDIALGAQSLTNDVDPGSGQAGAIAARNSINIGAANVVNREHALIQSLGDMSFGRTLDVNRLASGTADSIINGSATIDAGGTLRFQTASLVNSNNHFSTTVQDDASLTRHVTEYAYWDQPDVWYTADRVTWSDSGGGGIVLVLPNGDRFEKFYKRDYTEVVQKTVVLSSDPGKISSGGNMILSGNVTNDKSVMVAGGTLSGMVGAINNIGATGTETTVDHMTAGENYYHWVDGHPHQNHYTYNQGGAAYDNVLASTTMDLPVWSVQQNTNPGSGANPAAAQTVSSSTVPSTNNINGVMPSANGPSQTIGNAANPLPNLSVPNNRLFILHSQPGQKYLVETDPKFTDYKTFVSSDYMLSRLAIDPLTIQKRLGDGFYEQKVIGDQITQLTGKRTLGGYATAEDQYKALMDNGVATATKFQLTPGIALSDAQMAALTSDIVWLVAQNVTLPDGTQTSVLAPVVYLSRVSTNDIGTTGSLVSAKDIDLTVNGTLNNGGTLLASNSMIVQATDIKNTGKIKSADPTGSVALSATNDVISSGSISGNRVGILAGRDVTLETTTASNMAMDGLNTKIDQVSSINAGQLTVQAGRDANLVAAAINTTGDASIVAGRDLNLTTVKTQDSYNVAFNADNHLYETSTQVSGTAIGTGGALTLAAMQDVNAQAAYANAGGALQVAAGRDLNLGTAQEERSIDQAIYTTSKGFMASYTSRSQRNNDSTSNVGSTLSGDSIQVQVGNNLNVVGSNIVGTKDVTLTAANDISITTSQDVDQRYFKSIETKSGLMSGNNSVSVGKQTKGLEQTQTAVIHNLSTIGSETGNVTIQAGRDVGLVGTQLQADKNVSISGRNVDIKAVVDTLDTRTLAYTESTGIRLGAKSNVTDAAMALRAATSRGQEVSDPRLKALYAAKAAYAAKDLAQIIETAQKSQSGSGGLSGRVSIGIGTTREESLSVTHVDTVQKSQVAAGGDLNITARGDTTPDQGDIHLKGSALTGDNITLDAKRDLVSESQQAVSHTEDSYRRLDAEVGLYAGGTMGGNGGAKGGLGIYGALDYRQSSTELTNVTHVETTIDANKTLTIKTGRDATLTGTVATADQIKAAIGRNLTLTSEQDTDSYRQKQVGGQIEGRYAFGNDSGVSGSLNYSQTSSDYKSVQEQTGLNAGQGGFDISVGNHTQLNGAKIDSQASADKNQLITDTLGHTDLKNEASYNTISASVSFGNGSGGMGGGAMPSLNPLDSLLPGVGVPTSDSKDSTTKSAVAAGTIVVKSDQENGQDSTKDLSRDTANANQTLDRIFDAKKVAEQQELGRVLGEVGNRAIGDLSEKLGYKDGSPEKIALHAMLGALQAGLAGGSPIAGAAAGAASEWIGTQVATYLANQKDLQPTGDDAEDRKRASQVKAIEQWASLISGAAVGGVVGGSGNGALAGGATALDAERYNRQLHPREISWLERNNKSAAQVMSEKLGRPVTDQEALRYLTMAGEGDVDRTYQNEYATTLGLQTSEERQLYNAAKQYLAQNAKETFIDENGVQQTLFKAKGSDFNNATVYSQYRNDQAYRDFYWNTMGDNLKPDNPTPQELTIYEQREAIRLINSAKQLATGAIPAVMAGAAGVVLGKGPISRGAGKTSVEEFVPAENQSTSLSKSDGVYATLGLTRDPLTFPDGVKMVNALQSKGLSSDEAIREARSFINSGSTSPVATPLDITDKLVKVVPSGGAPSTTTGYWMRESQLQQLQADPASLANKLGLPPGMQVDSFDVFQITPKQGAVVYESKIAPTTVNGVPNTLGGATQTIVVDRTQFSQPVKTGTIKVNKSGG